MASNGIVGAHGLPDKLSKQWMLGTLSRVNMKVPRFVVRGGRVTSTN